MRLNGRHFTQAYQNSFIAEELTFCLSGADYVINLILRSFVACQAVQNH